MLQCTVLFCTRSLYCTVLYCTLLYVLYDRHPWLEMEAAAVRSRPVLEGGTVQNVPWFIAMAVQTY